MIIVATMSSSAIDSDSIAAAQTIADSVAAARVSYSPNPNSKCLYCRKERKVRMFIFVRIKREKKSNKKCKIVRKTREITTYGLISSEEDSDPFCSDLTISCFASEVLVPVLVRLIFILSPLSNVA